MPHEDTEQVRINVAVEAELAEDGRSFGQAHRSLVGAVFRSERFEDIGDAHHPRLHDHRVARQSARVALAVHALVMATGVLRSLC